MTRIFVLFFAMTFPIFAFAVPVRVQTGEHANFTRIVVTIPPQSNWQLGRNEVGYVLRVPVSEGFDLRGFFNMIPRLRVEDVSEDADAGELQFTVSCVCYADAFLDRPDILVIDIRDGPPPQTARFENTFGLPVVAVPVVTAEPDVPMLYRVPQNRILPLIFPPGSATDVAQVSDKMDDPIRAESNLPDIAEPDEAVVPSRDEDLLALERSITESLARGLSQGLLNADLDQNTSGIVVGLSDDFLPPGIETRTSVDLAAIPADPQVKLTQAGQVCLPDAFFDVGQWGDDGSFSEQVSPVRASLTGEFDRLDEDAVLKLAQLYVYFGFGREAAQTLLLDGASSQERVYLTAMAKIIDGDPVAADLFVGQVSCLTSVALWAMLAKESVELDGKVDPASVLRAFKALPSSLQSHLSPALSERFLAIGDRESALQALASAQSTRDPTLDAQLAEASLLDGLGETEAAFESLSMIARTDARATPNAMTAFLKAAVSEGSEVNNKDFMFADTLRFENARLPIATDLGVAQIRAYLHQDHFDIAQDLMADLMESLDLKTQSDLKNELAAGATARMNDAAFLTFAFMPGAVPSSDEIQNEMARRLLDIGFPDHAGTFVLAVAAPELEAERFYLRAEAELMAGNAQKVIDLLVGTTTERAGLMRMAAQDLQVGAVTGATMLSQSTTPESLWRRGELDALIESDDPLLREASTAALDLTVATLEPTAPLSSGLDLIGQSAQSRAVVDDLLNRFVVSTDF